MSGTTIVVGFFYSRATAAGTRRESATTTSPRSPGFALALATAVPAAAPVARHVGQASLPGVWCGALLLEQHRQAPAPCFRKQRAAHRALIVQAVLLRPVFGARFET